MTRSWPVTWNCVPGHWNQTLMTLCHFCAYGENHHLLHIKRTVSGDNFFNTETRNAETHDTARLEDADAGIRTDIDVDRKQLLHLIENFKADKRMKRLAKEHLITSKKMYRNVIKSFGEKLMSDKTLSENAELCNTVENILKGSVGKEDLFPFFLCHAQSIHPLVGPAKKLLDTSNLRSPASWFPQARAKPRRVMYHAGPTNSGKTHQAMYHFNKARTAIYCAPLRLLAHEIFHKSNTEGVECDLLTGEESQFSSGDPLRAAPRLSCTVEMAFSNRFRNFSYDVGIIDEIQMIADPKRGGAWTRALLGIPASEVHLCGHECAIDLIKRIALTTGDTLEIQHYKRLSPLVTSDRTLKGHYDTVKPGDCVVTFSRKNVFEISQLIEKAAKQSCAVIYGDLPPAIRVKQAKMFNDPKSDCNIMVATDAIGMGLNLNIRRIIFQSLMKSDGNAVRNLSPAHARQVAGRAGRFGKEHSKGFVTTFLQKDFKLLQKLLKSDIDDTEKAGLYPTLEQIEHFSQHIPQAKLHEILALFNELAELDGNYFLCDLTTQIELAYELKDVDMELEEIFPFSLAPVDTKKTKVVDALVKFAECFSEGDEVSADVLYKCLGKPPTVAKLPSQIAMLEQKYEVVNLYLWLAMRFPEIFVDAEEARFLQDAIEEYIEKSLLLKPSLKSVHRRPREKVGKRTRRAM